MVENDIRLNFSQLPPDHLHCTSALQLGKKNGTVAIDLSNVITSTNTLSYNV